ncbi:MAG: Mandelate racemase/muconate lactonizing protein [Acidimicrobiales bacterium]|nr:Mandelate racemase/muconate lactonizing protein [Acidimicrobiales bacterium]
MAPVAPGRRVIDRGGQDEPIEVELVRVRVPLLRPFGAAHGIETVRDVVLVRVVLADGSEGWGECSALSRPTYTGEHTAGAWAVLRDELVPARLGGRTSPIVGHPMASASLLDAEVDARLRSAGRSLAGQLAGLHGDEPRPFVAMTAVVGRNGSIDERLTMVATHVDEGVALVKMKVTPGVRDLEAVGEVRAAWPQLRLAVDFNGSADLASLAALDGLDLAYVEQPAPADALVESAFLAGRIAAPVALDESITGPGTFTSAVALGAGSVVNVKPSRLGGSHAAAQLVSDAVNAGVAVFVGGMLETGVGRASALAVAALPGCTLPTDLGPSSRYLAVDLTDPIVTDAAGRIVVPDGPGTGRVPDPDRLDAAAVDRILLAR